MRYSSISRLSISASVIALGAAWATPAAAQATTPQTTTAVDCQNLTDPAAQKACADRQAAAIEGQTDNATAPATAANGQTATDGQNSIVVTGSRIRQPEYTGVEPVTVVTKQEITQAGFISATDALQSQAVTQGQGQINNFYGGFVTDGGVGANTLGLRGLGADRTLILLNGHRLAPGGTRGSVVAADLNVLPTAIIDRIEVLKTGASSVYGSDAIAGVVNIITDKKLDGLHVDMQANVPQIGAGDDKRISASYGLQTGRLSLVGSLEYRNRSQISINDQPWFQCPIGGFLNGEGTPFGSGDAFAPDDPRDCYTLDNGGVTINTLGFSVLGVNSAGNPALVGVPAIGRTSGALGTFTRFVPNTGTPTAGDPFPGFLGVGTYDRDTFTPEMERQALISGAKIYTGYLSGTYDLDALGHAQIYGEVLATRRKSSAPLYRQLALDYLQDSPLLPANLQGGYFSNPVNTSSGQLVAARAFIGYGLLPSTQQVDYVRASGGVRGDFFFPGWRYDFYAGKSWNDGTYEQESFLIDRIANATDVVQNPDGSITCRSAASNPTCVPAPFLTAAVIGGNLPAAFRDYIVDNTIGHTSFRETTYSANFDGPLFHMWGGDAQLSVGAEYRKQSINDQPDQNSIQGNLLGLTAGTPTVGSDSVKEVFGELYLPLLADKPFAYRLNFTGSVRYTDYRSYGSQSTYKLAGEYEPIHGFGFRGSYGTSYRAPALSEQFLGATSGFLGAGSDPCSDLNTDNPSPTDVIIASNCASIGLPADFEQHNGITEFQVGGAEAGLSAETSKNWTVGVVARPTLPWGLGQISASLDYFNIKVSNGVSALSGDTILSRCYSDPNFDPNAGFCRFVTRDANNGLSVISSYVNLSQDIVKGYEFNARYARRLFGNRFVLNADVTHYTEQATKLFPEEYLTNANGIVTQPDWVANVDATYEMKHVTFRYGVDWIDASRNRTYDYFAFDNQTGITDPDLVQAYRDFYYLETPDYFLHSASVQFDVKNYELTLGVRNLFNKRPPSITNIGFSTVGNAPLYSGYDYTGRTFFVNVNFKI
jgi:iron complex outermembrane receptor protein